jgi:hypothetical protein
MIDDFWIGFIVGLCVQGPLWLLLFRKRPGPDICLCGHARNVHTDGKGKCRVSYGISDAFPTGSMCACHVFIKKPEPKPPKDKAAKELEKMVGL